MHITRVYIWYVLLPSIISISPKMLKQKNIGSAIVAFISFCTLGILVKKEKILLIILVLLI